MHNKIYDGITLFAKFFIMIFIILMFIITKSIYINLFVPLLVIYIILINSEKLNKYLRILKNYLILNILILIILMLIFGIKLILIYKFIVIILLIDLFILELNFQNTNSLIYKIIRNKYISYRITLKLYYINSIFMSKDEIREFQEERGIKKYGLRHRLFARLEYAEYKKNKFDSNLKTNFYVINIERTNLLSIFLFVFFLFLLIIVIIRK